METFNTINTQIFRFFNGLAGQSEISDSLFVVTATSFAYVLCFFVIAYLFLHHDKEPKKLFGFSSYFREPFMVIGVTVISWVFVIFLKNIFDIPRPFVVLSGVEGLVVHGFNDSFPSGHTMVLTSLASGVVIYHRRLGVLLLILAFLIGVMRIVVGVHYPADILGGFLIGALLPFVAREIVHKIYPNN